MLLTRYAFPDIPPLYVYYRVDHSRHSVVFLGLHRAWDERDERDVF